MEKGDIEKVVRGLVEKMGVALDALEITEVGGHTLFTIRTKDSGVLIGTGGDTLHALNHIVKKIFEGRGDAKTAKEDLRFVVDVNGYHLKYIQELEGQAKMLAERARTFKYDVEMSPMSPYDRLIVHASLQGSPNIKTESAGEGTLRHIVIKYVSDASATSPVLEQ